MRIPTICPDCSDELTVSWTGKGGTGSVATAHCPGCGYRETFE